MFFRFNESISVGGDIQGSNASRIVGKRVVCGGTLRVGNKTKVVEKNLVNHKFFIQSMFNAIVAESL